MSSGVERVPTVKGTSADFPQDLKAVDPFRTQGLGDWVGNVLGICSENPKPLSNPKAQHVKAEGGAHSGSQTGCRALPGKNRRQFAVIVRASRISRQGSGFRV